ncbi:hypothetical protein ACQVP6_08235 [Bacillus cereus]
MTESTKELNEILRKYNVSAEEVIEMLTLCLERKVSEDPKETVEEYGEEEFERLFKLHIDLNKLDWKYNFPY